MRKFAALLCVIAVLLLLSGCQENFTHGVYEVTITASPISNNGVGHDWIKTYTCEGRTIASGERWIVPLNNHKAVTIYATITESDKWPDVGSSSLFVALENGYETSAEIVVTENKGRYIGRRAQWNVICQVKLVEKLKKEE